MSWKDKDDGVGIKGLLSVMVDIRDQRSQLKPLIKKSIFQKFLSI